MAVINTTFSILLVSVEKALDIISTVSKKRPVVRTSLYLAEQFASNYLSCRPTL